MTCALLAISTGPCSVFVPSFVESARQHFHPIDSPEILLFSDVPHSSVDHVFSWDHRPWPAPTLFRYHAFLSVASVLMRYDHLFYCDIDMRFVGPVGPEILSPLTATLHPGFVLSRGTYETRPESSAYVAPAEGCAYYCGAFFGGERDPFLDLARSVVRLIDLDQFHGLTAVWNDESYLNRHLIDHPPSLTLSPSYCYPDDQPDYYRSRWPEPYEPRIIALSQPKFR